jgi:hypothetical protein
MSATPVRFTVPGLAAGGSSTSATVLLELVDDLVDGQRIQAISEAGDPIAEARTWTLFGSDNVLLLEAQATIYYPTPTWYRATISQVIGQQTVKGVYVFQVPVSSATQDLLTLIGYSLIDPADISAELLVHGETAYGWGDHALAGYSPLVHQHAVTDIIGLNEESAEAVESIPAGAAVRITYQGKAALADAVTPGCNEVVGLAIAQTAPGFSCTYTRSLLSLADWSMLVGSYSLTPGSVYYLSPIAPGRLTKVPPETAGQFLVRIGRATEATTLQLLIEPPISL